jgi:hypothetical protein
MEYFLIFTAVAIAGWWFKFRKGRNTASDADTTGTRPINEQELARLQGEFERRLGNDSDLPDGIRGRDAYIYWNLMRNWFDSLIAANRYDDQYANKLRRDWYDYIQLLPQVKTARFLALATNDKTMASAYDQGAGSAVRSIELIQNAFATAVGAEAMEVLLEVRGRDTDAFDRSGRRPMAPKGYRYFPVSISPYIEECQLKTSDKVEP